MWSKMAKNSQNDQNGQQGHQNHKTAFFKSTQYFRIYLVNIFLALTNMITIYNLS